jgi:hypothetical protein
MDYPGAGEIVEVQGKWTGLDDAIMHMDNCRLNTKVLQRFLGFCRYIPYPAVSAHIRITFPVSSEAWTLATATLTLCTMTTSKTILAHFRTPEMQNNKLPQKQ